MSGINGRQKGARAEREVAAILQQWWRRLEPDCSFVKTPLSGGWSTPQLRAEYRVSGDLTTSAVKFPWTIEVKRREEWSLERLLAGKTSPVWSWWRQALAQGSEAGLAPMLWIRRSREPWRIVQADASWCGAVVVMGEHVVIVSEASILLSRDPREFVKEA